MQLLFVLALALVAAYANAFATNAATLAQNGWSWGWTSGYNNYQVRTPNGYVAISWAATVFDAMYGGVNWSSWTASGYSYWDVLAMSAGTYTWTTGTFSWWWTPNGWWGNTPSGSMRSAAWIWSWLYGTDDYSDDYWGAWTYALVTYTWSNGTYGWSTLGTYTYWSYIFWSSWSIWGYDDSYAWYDDFSYASFWWWYTYTPTLVMTYSPFFSTWGWTYGWVWTYDLSSYSAWGSWTWGSYWGSYLDDVMWSYSTSGWEWWYSYTLVWVKISSSSTPGGQVTYFTTTTPSVTTSNNEYEADVQVNRLEASTAPNESSASLTKHVALALASMVAIALCM